MLTASLLNAEACCRAAIQLKRDIVILCAGSHDEFAIEDGLCAGLLIDQLLALCPAVVEMEDFGTTMLSLYRNRAGELADTITRGSSGRRLTKLGMKHDIAACVQIDKYQEAPRLIGDQLVRG
ncbi:putative 2-phosphosulfolactate phosphatase [compost metagenome]